jgi:tetratricopeptide (TPR) repeat protein
MIFALAALLAFGEASFAQHQLRLRNDPQPKVGTISGADGRTVQFQTQAGTLAYPLGNVEGVTMPPPAEVGQAQQALQAGDSARALQLWRAVNDKYKGLPTDWAKLAAASVANLLVSAGEFDRAEAAFRDLEQMYPGGGDLVAKVGKARIAIGKNDLLSAKDALVSIVDDALKLKNVPRENAFAYSQAFFAMGMINESEGNLQDALENYLRTVTIFFHDPSARTAALERADAIRASNQNKKTSEQILVP